MKYSGRGKHVTVIQKDGTSCSGYLFMTVSTSQANSGSSQPRKYIHLQIGESRKVVRINVDDILEVVSAETKLVDA